MKTFSQSTEFVALGGSTSTPGFNLMWDTQMSCGVDMGDLYVVIGGTKKKKNYKEITRGIRKVGLYNDNGFVRNLPDLVMGRYEHACAGFQDINGDMVGVILFYS